MTTELRAVGFDPGGVLEHSATVELTVFLVAFAQAGGLDALANALAKVFARHDGKRFVVRGPGNAEIEAEGYSVDEVRELLGAAAEWVEQRDAVWRRQIEAGSPTSNHELRSKEDETGSGKADET